MPDNHSARRDNRPLWLGIQLPWLPLTVFERGNGNQEPLAVVSGREVVLPNRSAIRGGVSPGMGAAGAQALIPALRLRERDSDDEIRLLDRLAGWALHYSATVSPEPPLELLLEIGGSLRYFGGLECLRGRIEQDLDDMGHATRLGIAPTPTAALLRARAGRGQPLLTTDELADGIGELPIGVLSLPAREQRALTGLGMERIHDCLALPRGGLARRFGASLLNELHRALGDVPDPRRHWQPPATYDDRLELPAEAANSDHLLFGLRRLLQGLCAFLRGAESATQRIDFRLEHRNHGATPFSIGLVTPGRDPAHLLNLVQERLERIQLPAPVIGLELSCRDIHAAPATEQPLLDDNASSLAPKEDRLIDHLVARLGEHRIRGLATQADPRPERAWSQNAPGTPSATVPMVSRPLWLLDDPVRLELREGQLQWQGPLQLREGPERIETGWWDGGDIARDYYVAINPTGEQLWIYHNRRCHNDWYLHGLFG